MSDVTGGPATTKMSADESLPEAGRRILRGHFLGMLAHEERVRLDDDIEGIHDMRVGVRRQRAMFRVIDPYYTRTAIRAFRDRLRTLATHLGVVRDLDVLISAANAYQLSSPETLAALEPVLGEWQRDRAGVRDTLVAYLDSSDYRAFVEDYGIFLSSAGVGVKSSASADSSKPHLVRDIAPGVIWSHYGRVRAYEAALGRASMETLHALRIDGKRLRYLLEFFGDVLGPGVAKAVEPLVALQDHLGEMHDAHVAAGLLNQFLTVNAQSPLDLHAAESIGRYLQVKRLRLETLRRTLKQPWRQLVRKRFRRLLARIAADV